ncbi:rod shape-determining protein MreC [Candidatus Uhrbacteria bacterium]|nr:rod shape-determining protein MreC [Candidatus Uhrbacteria bacterium]
MFRSRPVLLFLGACFAAIFLILAGLFRPLGDLGRRLTLPLVRFFSDQTTRILGTDMPHGNTFSSESLAKLQERLRLLSVDSARLSALEEENKNLRAQAKFLSSSGYDSVGARVISRDLSAGRALLLIDRGLRDGIESGQAVITRDGIFIGHILSLKEQVATIELLSDPQSRVAASVVGGEGLIGVVEGRGNGAAMLNFIPSSEQIIRDQIVVTAGGANKIPKNLPLGIVNAVQGKSTDPFLTATIEPLVPLDALVLVSILRPSVLKPAL